MSYVLNAWYVAAWSTEIEASRLVGIRILNEPIVLWRRTAGEIVALEDRCVHRLAPLSLGRCEGENLRCMYHGLLYDQLGSVVEIPGQDRVPSSLRVRSYPAVERYGWIWVWMGNAAAAEAGLIPAVGVDHTDYVVGHGQLDYSAESRLIIDNLLDLSHLTFLHAESFAMGETWARERPTVTALDRGVHITRWLKGEGPMGEIKSTLLVDTYFSYDCFVPGVLTMASRIYPVGTADSLKGEPPDLQSLAQSFTTQAVTPLTDKTARYFYVVGSLRHGQETVYDMTTYDKGFAEDKAMIEAQQRNIDATPGWRFVPTSADHGVVLFNRLIEKLAREEPPAFTAALQPA